MSYQSPIAEKLEPATDRDREPAGRDLERAC
jgi:hypothetical protein